MKRALSFLFFLSMGLVLFGGAQAATAPKLLGKFGYWSAYQMFEGENPVCYMSITAKPPVKKGEKKAKRGDVVLMVTHRPSENALDVISYAAGAKFKSASDVTFKINGKDYSLFTQGDTAWARDQAGDRAIVGALRSVGSATVAGTLANGAALADTVNLKGMPDAYYAIGKACGLEVSPPKKAAPKTDKKPAKTAKPAAKKQ